MKYQPQPLTRQEARALLAACSNTTTGIRDRAVFTVLYRGGCRITATLKTRPADIDWPRGLITVHEDKGGKGRVVVLDAEAMDVLRVWMERRKALGINGHHVLFCATNVPARGNRLDSSHFRHKIKALRKKAKIQKRCHCHGLRHTAASEMCEEGIPLPIIAAQLGHKHVSTTSAYIHRLRPDIACERLRQRKWDGSPSTPEKDYV